MSVSFPPQQVLAVTFPMIVRFLVALGQAQPGPSVRATSWWRDVETNRRVGGAPDSQHLLALALDVVGEKFEIEQLAHRLRQLGIVAIQERTHLHLQLLPAGMAREIGLLA